MILLSTPHAHPQNPGRSSRPPWCSRPELRPQEAEPLPPAPCLLHKTPPAPFPHPLQQDPPAGLDIYNKKNPNGLNSKTFERRAPWSGLTRVELSCNLFILSLVSRWPFGPPAPPSAPAQLSHLFLIWKAWQVETFSVERAREDESRWPVVEAAAVWTAGVETDGRTDGQTSWKRNNSLDWSNPVDLQWLPTIERWSDGNRLSGGARERRRRDLRRKQKKKKWQEKRKTEENNIGGYFRHSFLFSIQGLRKKKCMGTFFLCFPLAYFILNTPSLFLFYYSSFRDHPCPSPCSFPPFAPPHSSLYLLYL